jgi:hypothetical protein
MHFSKQRQDEIYDEGYEDGRFEGYRAQRRLSNPYRRGWARSGPLYDEIFATVWAEGYTAGYLVGKEEHARDMANEKYAADCRDMNDEERE